MVGMIAMVSVAALGQVTGAITLGGIVGGILGNRSDALFCKLMETTSRQFSRRIALPANANLRAEIAAVHQQSIDYVAATLASQARNERERIIADKIVAASKLPAGIDPAAFEGLPALIAPLLASPDSMEVGRRRDGMIFAAEERLISWLEELAEERLPDHFRAVIRDGAPNGRVPWHQIFQFCLSEAIVKNRQFGRLFLISKVSEIVERTINVEILALELKSELGHISGALARIEGSVHSIDGELASINAHLSNIIPAISRAVLENSTPRLELTTYNERERLLLYDRLSSAYNLERSNSDPFSPKERMFLAQLEEDIASAVFPDHDAIRESLPKIQRRAKAVAGELPDPLTSFFSDNLDLSWPHPDSFIDAPVHVNCCSSSTLSITLCDIVRNKFPGFTYSIASADNESQIRDALDCLPEVVTLANASYYSTSQGDLRAKYINYVPLHPSRDLVFVKAASHEAKTPMARRQFIIANSSGLEPKRMGVKIEDVKSITEIQAATAADIDLELQVGDVIYIWQSFIRELGERGFRPYNLNTHSTWFSLFLRRDLVSPTVVARQRRQSILACLRFAMQVMGDPFAYLAEQAEFRAALRDHWTG